jgi:integrase
MSKKPISPLRQRMIEDMVVRNFVEKTRNDYIRQVKSFTTFFGRSPDTAIPEDLRRFQLHQTRTGVRPPSINGSVAALRFFFTVTLDRPEMARHLTFVREPRKIPAVLSPEEMARLLEAAPGPKYKAALSAAYAAGLRVSEVVALKVSDIDSERLLLRIEHATQWLAERQAELLPVPYFHVVFTLPAAIADLAYQNKAAIYDLLFKASSETVLAIAADPKHLGARIGITAVLHSWGSALTQNPHS